MFRTLFADPHYLLQLYRTLHPDDHTTSEQNLQIVTMGQLLFNGIYNDLGFLVGDRLLVLAEAQSTWSENIVLRELTYLFGTYQEYLSQTKANLYGTKAVHLPRPEMYVIYTRERGNHPEWLSFKDTFFPDEDCPIDARVRVLYADHTHTIVDQYIRFCMVFDRERSLHGDTEMAITETIRICCDENLLRDFLLTHRAEVMRMLGTLFSQEYMDKMKLHESMLGVALKMLKRNVHLDDIVEFTELSPEDVRRLARDNGLSAV